MKKPKIVTVEIPEERDFHMTGELIEKYSHEEFNNWAGGHLATALFKGEIIGAVRDVVSASMARAKLDYHKELVRTAKGK